MGRRRAWRSGRETMETKWIPDKTGGESANHPDRGPFEAESRIPVHPVGGCDPAAMGGRFSDTILRSPGIRMFFESRWRLLRGGLDCLSNPQTGRIREVR